MKRKNKTQKKNKKIYKKKHQLYIEIIKGTNFKIDDVRINFIIFIIYISLI